MLSCESPGRTRCCRLGWALANSFDLANAIGIDLDIHSAKRRFRSCARLLHLTQRREDGPVAHSVGRYWFAIIDSSRAISAGLTIKLLMRL